MESWQHGTRSRSITALVGVVTVALLVIEGAAPASGAGPTEIKEDEPVTSASVEAKGRTTKNLIKNPGAEKGKGQKDYPSSPKRPREWRTRGNFTFHKYDGAQGGLDAGDSAAIGGGKEFFAGGPNNRKSKAFQKIDLRKWKKAIKRGRMKAKVRAHIGGWEHQEDFGVIKVKFFRGNGSKIRGKTMKKRGPGAAERNSDKGFKRRKMKQTVPRKARSAKVMLIAKRKNGFYNDGYFDNVVFKLKKKRRGFEITDVDGPSEVESDAPREDLAVSWKGTARFPVTLTFGPRPDFECSPTDAGKPVTCNTREETFDEPTDGRTILWEDVVWCEGFDEDDGRYTFKYRIVMEDDRGRTDKHRYAFTCVP